MKFSNSLIPLVLVAGSVNTFPSLTGAQSIDHAPFADELTQELYTAVGENECTSSLGVSMAMSLVYPSAISDSEMQMRTVLGYPDDTTNSQSTLLWNAMATSLTNRYQGRCYNEFDGECSGNEPALELANSVFLHDEFTLNATYEAVVGDFVQTLDFSSDDAGGQVNAWVNESTNGLIDSIVNEGPLSPWFMVAINSIYLKASWMHQFEEDYTNADLFYVTPEAESTAHFMNQVESFQYSHEALPGYQVLQHSFVGGEDSSGLSMIFVLPFPEFAGDMTSSVDVLAAIPMLERTRVAFALPKFKFESEYKDDLKAALLALGMTAPFEERPDNMCIVEGRCDAFIDAIIQKTFIDVNEKGVEAAAVTALGLSLTSLPPPQAVLFLANRPFQFFLYDEVENLVIFEGQVGEPGVASDSVATLEGNHADPDFWQTNFGIEAVMPEAPATVVPETIDPEQGTEDPESDMSTTSPEVEDLESDVTEDMESDAVTTSPETDEESDAESDQNTEDAESDSESSVTESDQVSSAINLSIGFMARVAGIALLVVNYLW